jgi:hypothetical protein
MNDKLLEKKQDFINALEHIGNIIEGSNEKVERFKFTNKELQALIFTSELLSTHIKEFERY